MFIATKTRPLFVKCCPFVVMRNLAKSPSINQFVWAEIDNFCLSGSSELEHLLLYLY